MIRSTCHRRTGLHFPMRRMTAAALLLGLLAAGAGAQDQDQDQDQGQDQEVRKLTVKSFVDFGHLVSGRNAYATDGGLNPDISMLPLNRINVLAIQDITLGRFDVSVGLSGLIWWPYGGLLTDIREKLVNVKPMVPVARARWKFGDPKASGTSGSVMLGTFNYKYNPDAKDLGEYLYRSGTYPGFLTNTEGWLLLNRAGNYSHGLLASTSSLDGMLKQNVSLFMEMAYYPVGDFSPGYDFSLTGKWLEFGGGVVLNHYLPIRPSTLTPKLAENTYVKIRGKDSLGNVTVEKFGKLDETSVENPVDTTILHRWTFKGVKAMGRVAVNLGSMIPEAYRGPEDLRVFAEAAVLGWENQPIYYAKRSERIPVMVGINLPTAKALDVLTVQGEYYKSPYNDIDLYNLSSLPIWKTATTDSVHADDFRWAVYAKKSVNKAMTAYAQVASDNFRLTDGSLKMSSVPLIHSPKDWYYLVRLEFNLR